MTSDPGAALVVSGLSVGYMQRQRVREVVHDFTLEVRQGELIGIAGESGCGKSTAVLALTGFRSPGMRVLAGSSHLDGVDLLEGPEVARAHWGTGIAYLPQDAATSLTPNRSVGGQFAEVLRRHLRLDRRGAAARTREFLDRVQIPSDDRALDRYPFQFSGGQQQRIALAIALAVEPTVLVLDEPTTGLDVTTQARVAELVDELVAQLGTATLYVSHDLGLLRSVSDRVAIMYAGQLVESGSALDIWAEPRHPYAAALLAAAPSVARAEVMVPLPGLPPPEVIVDRCSFSDRCRHHAERCDAPVSLRPVDDRLVRCVRAEELGPLQVNRPEARVHATLEPELSPTLSVEVATAHHGRGGTRRQILESIEFTAMAKRTLAIVGESGSGKSTLMRVVAGLHGDAAMDVRLHGEPVAQMASARPLEQRRALQLVFQNPASSLNPRRRVAAILERPLALFFSGLGRAQRSRRVDELLDAVRLEPQRFRRSYPGELSGGQQQRVALARALAAEPSVLLCDEVVSALDVSVQASIIDLIGDLREQADLAVVFVTHDLALVRAIADQILVLKDGRIVEARETEALFDQPETSYTRELLDAAAKTVAVN